MIIRIILTPLSWVYGLITAIRNLLYDRGILKSYHPDIPVIVVGNLIAGGTGKSPFIAWIAGELSKKYRVAVLSRGYGRSSRGFLLVEPDTSPKAAGDEPAELKMRLPNLLVAVDANRRRGIKLLASGKYGKPDLILMDDGFQHRRVTPGYAIVLDDFNRPAKREKMLPAGLRREPLSGLKRADLVITTKKETTVSGEFPAGGIILVTGIANPGPLVAAISAKTKVIQHLKFPDHHRYTAADALRIREAFQSADAGAVILTTGKDFVKLTRLPELAGIPLQWMPAGPPVEPDQMKSILKKINDYVEKALANS